MMGVKLCSEVYPQMIYKNNAGKKISAGINNRKPLAKVYNCYFSDTILQLFCYHMGAHNLVTQIEALHKLVPVAKRKLF